MTTQLQGGDLYRQLAEMHGQALDQGFLRLLGPKVLAELYRAMDVAPQAILIVASREGRVQGFIAAAPGLRVLLPPLARRAGPLIWALVPRLGSWRVWYGLFEIARHSRQPKPAGLPEMEGLSFAIRPDLRGSPVAVRLYGQLCQRLAADGHSAFHFTVGETLPQAIRFYARHGAYPLQDLDLHAGQTSKLYVQPLDLPQMPRKSHQRAVRGPSLAKP